ncbi:MAG: poly-beta-1,6-N-acetyl-D-glucosamine biosynthesis protein PgaD [Sulfurimonas sp.]|jgi:biofilm PGA synthesis protein PgaD|nr:poly-beta-1,6-N-acetyl-D-glucosamine biosynthesis protein PgaD [Sulfurimonas sp.]
MSKDTLIINKRHELPLVKRVLWDIVTIALWLGWLYLWKPVFIIFYKIVTLDASFKVISAAIFDEINAVPFENAIFMLIATPLVLFVLSRLNRHMAATTHLLYTPSEYARYFQLQDAVVEECVASQFVTVHHDEQGRITYLENKIVL